MKHRFLAYLALMAIAAVGAAANVQVQGADATVNVSVRLSPPVANYKVTYKGCTLTHENGSDLQAVSVSGASITVKIQRLKKLPKSINDVAGKYLYLIDSPGVGRFAIDGNLTAFYTDAPVALLDAGGSVGSVSTKNVCVGRIASVRGIGSIRMAATPGGVNPTWSATRVASGRGSGPLQISLTGIVLEDLSTSQTVGTLATATKAFRNKVGGTSGVATGGLGRIAPSAVADTSRTCNLVALAFASIASKGACMRPDGLVSRGPVEKITGKTLSLNGTACLAVLGWEAQSSRMLMKASRFGLISADTGVHGRFWAGFDAQGPTYTGGVDMVAAKAGMGILSGELCVAPGTQVVFKPDQGSMQVLTSGH